MAMRHSDMLRVALANKSDDGPMLVSTRHWLKIMKRISPLILHSVVKEGSSSCIESILASDATIETDNVDDRGITPFILAACSNHVEIVRSFLRHRERRPVDLNRRVRISEDANVSAIVLAAVRGHTEVVKLLLAEEGVNVNHKCSEVGASALQAATELGDVDVVRLLVKHGRCDVNAQNFQGSTALHVAALHCKTDIVRTLLECGRCDPAIQANDGSCAEDCARHEHIIELFRRRADIDRAASQPITHRLRIDFREGKEFKTTVWKKGGNAK